MILIQQKSKAHEEFNVLFTSWYFLRMSSNVLGVKKSISDEVGDTNCARNIRNN